jgi:hypothetical protein
MSKEPRNHEFKTMLNDLSLIDQADALNKIANRRFRQRIIITFRPLKYISVRAAATQQRIFVEQIVIGVYRVIDDKAAVFVAHTIDRAVVKAGHDPKSVDGRLYRQTVAKRLTLVAMLFNVVCAILNPSSLPLLGAYIFIWPWYLWRSSAERKSLGV